jgi:hypothetical protein
VANVFAKQQFTKTENSDGSTTYTRKTLAPVAKSGTPAASIDDVPTTPTQSTTPEPMTEGGPVETLKEVVPEPSTLYGMLKQKDPADVMRSLIKLST